MTSSPGLEALAPVYTSQLFEPLRVELMRVLRGLSPADWDQPTVAGSWRVADVVAHLLDGDLRRLSGDRDVHQFAAGPVNSPADLIRLVDDLNGSGVSYARRMSPRVMMDLLDATGPWVEAHFNGLDPHGEARWSVSWAGEQQSANWMDIGRDFTERWHHQQQIRDAVGLPRLLESHWLGPVLDLSVRVWPVAFAIVEAEPGNSVVFEVRADRPLAWTVVLEQSGWTVKRGAANAPSARVVADADVAWRIFYKALSPDAARRHVTIEGDERLVTPILSARSIITAG